VPLLRVNLHRPVRPRLVVPEGAAPAPPDKPRKEGRLTRHLRHARELRADPASAGALLRSGLLGIWRARGGGFYGLGYLITFLLLEARLLISELAQSDGVMDFVGGQIVEYLLRLGLLSVLNVLQAFIWPLHVLGALGFWGLVLLAISYFAFERGLRPRVESAFPELRRTG
jgi:hypothetical protein